jgi:hypothetical protein
MGWIVVDFPDTREVFVGGDSQGDNRENGQLRALPVGDGYQTVWLAPPADFEPPVQQVKVPPTSDAIRPFRVVFTRKA